MSTLITLENPFSSILLVIRNRQMTHDPDTYEDPFSFKPGRFLGENGNPVELDPGVLVFGFGRR